MGFSHVADSSRGSLKLFCRFSRVKTQMTCDRNNDDLDLDLEILILDIKLPCFCVMILCKIKNIYTPPLSRLCKVLKMLSRML